MNEPTSKRSAESVTDLYRRYRDDIFFSSRIRIIIFHIFFVAVTTLVILSLFDFAQRTTLSAVARSLQSTLQGGAPDGDIITEAVRLVEQTKLYVLGTIILLSVLFGFLAVQISLRPLREALALQKRFVSSIAHELRTPLAVLRVENEVASFEAPPDTLFSEVLTRNIEEIDRITDILNNLLLLNKFGTLQSSTFEMLDLGSVVKTVTSRLEKLAKGKGVTLRIDRSPAPEIYGSVSALEQALFNVTKNAIVYSDRGAEVRLRYHAITDQDVTILISDTGAGIAKKDLSHIFEPFFRSRTDVMNPGGTGIGLAIVFDIVKLHHGRLRVDSRPGRGTDFYITLPRRAEDYHAQVPTNNGVTYDFSHSVTSS